MFEGSTVEVPQNCHTTRDIRVCWKMDVSKNGGFPQQTHGCFLLKMIILGCEMGSTPIFGNTHMLMAYGKCSIVGGLIQLFFNFSPRTLGKMNPF